LFPHTTLKTTQADEPTCKNQSRSQSLSESQSKSQTESEKPGCFLLLTHWVGRFYANRFRTFPTLFADTRTYPQDTKQLPAGIVPLPMLQVRGFPFS
jgi:hypothetical protein